MITIIFGNQKGGTGKTTSTITVGAILEADGRRVLLVDLDPQSSLTQGLGIDGTGASMAEVIGGSAKLADIIQPIQSGLDLAPSDIALAGAELALVPKIGRENVLKRTLQSVGASYDVCLVDAPPSLGILTTNALTAANGGVIICTLPAVADLRGVRLFLDTIETVKDAGLNDGLQVIGALVTQYDARTIAHGEALDMLRGAGLDIVGIIPRGIKVQESAANTEILINYDPNGKPTAAYFEAAEEIKKWLD
jgi:chromosome partitioning protein